MSVVAILGASDNPSRYSYQALKLLLDKGHDIRLVNPRLSFIEGYPCVSSLDELEAVDTLTIYVHPQLLEKSLKDILKLAPRRVIMNPGPESENVRKALLEQKIEVIEGCTLVLLTTSQL